MTEDMPRKLDRYVFREITRHGKTVYYFRKDKGPRKRLPAPGSSGYDEAYTAARDGIVKAARKPASTKTMTWLVARYRDSSAYRALSPATRKQRDNIFAGVLEKRSGQSEIKVGDREYALVTRKSIVAGREERSATPAQARNYLDAMRGLFRWALDAELIKVDPTEGVKNPERPKTEGFAPWTEDEVAAYEAKWPVGTKERVWFDVLLYTGLRRGDAVMLGRQHVRDGIAYLKTEKTDTEVTVPILPPLAETLAAGPTSDLAFICGENGRPLTKESFGNAFRKACNAAGVKDKSAHGLRKVGAKRAAEAGATVNELEALFGWTGGTMASHYTKSADRSRLAKQASEKIRNALAPHHSMAVRVKSSKTQ